MVIGDDFKDRVREATDIAAVIGQYVTLKKRGKNLLGLCPFHTEKTPSFTVHPDRQFFHCFGCGKGGDVFTFLMDHEGWSFPETLKYLAEKAGIPLPQRRSPEETDRYGRLLAANAAAAEFFGRMIGQPEGRQALKYIAQRGVPQSRLAELGIGYAPDSWDGLLKFAARRKIPEQALLEAGLVVEKEGGGRYYDRFRDRLTFAIANLSGRVVGFGARALKQTEQAKYINSPETPVYRKSHLLYGLDKSREAIRQAGYAVVVEGYTDWTSLYLNGICNVVASSGTAFTAEQARLLARFSPNVVLLFDADTAGEKAALRGVEILFREGLDVKIATLPPGSDPDSAAREQGKEFVVQTLRAAKEYVSYRVGRARETMRSGGLLEQEAVIKELLATVGAVEDSVRRALLIKRIAGETGLAEKDLTSQLPVGVRESNRPAAAPTAQRSATKLRGNWEAEFVRLLLDNPSFINKVKADIHIEDFKYPELGRMYSKLVDLTPLPKSIVPTDLGETQEEKSAWARLAALEVEPDVDEQILADYVRKLTAGRPREQTADLKRKIKEAEQRGDQQEADRLTRKLTEKRLTGQ